MEQTILDNEITIRLLFFFGIFALIGLWEVFAPRRALTMSKAIRWGSNIGIVVLDSVVLRLAFPVVAVGFAAYVNQQGWGVLNQFELDPLLAIIIAVVVMDFTIWLQHVMVHAIPLFWRLHRMHHADLDYDLTTGARFHPLEIILSMGIKLAVIMLLGPPVVAVLIFEVILNALAMFNHGNIRMPLGLDKVLRLLIVTPDMHRVHHSVQDDETNSNFGFNLSIWDRIFGTYKAQPDLGHEKMIIGLDRFREPRDNTLPRMLVQPFIGNADGYAINRRTWVKHDKPNNE
jgi:sterol desaturase/sphingolipid hydroxylase (fatty acid hydroxylase superfamily)